MHFTREGWIFRKSGFRWLAEAKLQLNQLNCSLRRRELRWFSHAVGPAAQCAADLMAIATAADPLISMDSSVFHVISNELY